MPKPQPKTWSDDEINEFLKSRGHTQQAPAAPGAGGAGADLGPGTTGYPQGPGVLDQIRSFLGAGDAPIGRAPTYGEMDWQQAAAQGALRRGAELGVGAARLAGRALPEDMRSRVGGALESIPGVQRMEQFADEPDEGFAENIGAGALDIAAGGMIPRLGLGTLAARAMPRTVGTIQKGPVFRGPAGRWARGTTTGAIRNPTAVKAARTAGNVAETAGKGALGGAVTDPDNPERGAEVGAAGGVGGQAVGNFLRGPVGQWIGSHAARWGPSIALEEALHAAVPGLSRIITGGIGLPWLVHQYNSPVGSRLGQAGKAAFDAAGRYIGHLPATVGGEVSRATSDRPMVTVPRRVPPPEPDEPPPQGQ